MVWKLILDIVGMFSLIFLTFWGGLLVTGGILQLRKPQLDITTTPRVDIVFGVAEVLLCSILFVIRYL